jgi:alkylated DNA nucleotide flippase Atl1
MRAPAIDAALDTTAQCASPAIERRALIEFHRAVANAHEAYADALMAFAEFSEAPKPPAIRGSLQRRIVGLRGMTSERGMTSREVASELEGGDEPNCHTALKALADKEIVETIDGAPQRFRLAAKHRRDRALRLSRSIKKGEWTTYGDFSIAVYESPRMALTVARLAHHHPAFANPHRVLQSGGTVSSEWRDEDNDHGPEECKRRLSSEGAWLDAFDYAKPDRFVGWQELSKRVAGEGAAPKQEAHAAED